VEHSAAARTVQGALGRLATRIDLAFLLGLIGEIDRDDLHLIRQVRNEFAHHLAGVSFNSPTVVEKCDRVRLMKAMGWRFDPSQVPGMPLARLQYLGTATTLAGFLHNKIAITQHTKAIDMLASTDLPNASRE